MSKLKLPHAGARRDNAGAEGETATADAERTDTPDTAVEGEGSYTAADRYNRATKEFVQSHDVEAAAREAEPTSPAEASELAKAEDKGRSRTRGEDDSQTPRRRGRFLRRRR
jgi:hypothetical protein